MRFVFTYHISIIIGKEIVLTEYFDTFMHTESIWISIITKTKYIPI